MHPLLLIDDRGGETEVRVALGWPTREGDEGPWVCVVTLGGLDDHPLRVFGGDGLQAIALAIRLIEVRLTLAARRVRGRWFDPESREAIDLPAYLGSSVVVPPA